MTREQVYENLNEVFQDVFDDDSITVNDETTAADIEDWDSFEHINLVIAVEKRFRIKFTVGEANEMKNVGEMVDIILERVQA
jgi:acyl carrier protein